MDLCNSAKATLGLGAVDIGWVAAFQRCPLAPVVAFRLAIEALSARWPDPSGGAEVAFLVGTTGHTASLLPGHLTPVAALVITIRADALPTAGTGGWVTGWRCRRACRLAIFGWQAGVICSRANFEADAAGETAVRGRRIPPLGTTRVFLYKTWQRRCDRR